MEIQFRTGNEAALWPPGPCGVYLVFGEEDSLKSVVERSLVEKFVNPDFADFDFEVINADSATADRILSSASQAPFGSDRRVVIVRGMEQWRDRSRQSEVERLGNGIGALNPQACLVMIVGAEEEESRRKTAISAKLDAAVQARGMLVACRELKDEALADWIRDQVHSAGNRITREALDMLVSTVGNEMRSLDQEIYKLVNYVGDKGQISAADVSAVVSTHAEDVMFQCVDAISKRQTDRALLLLNELHRHDPKPQAVAGRLLSLLTRQYRMLWQAKFLAAKGVAPRDIRFLPQNLADELPTENSITQLSFRASDIFAASANYSVEDLQWSFDRLVLCDLANKGGVTEEDMLFTTDPAGNLQLLVLQLTGACSA